MHALYHKLCDLQHQQQTGWLGVLLLFGNNCLLGACADALAFGDVSSVDMDALGMPRPLHLHNSKARRSVSPLLAAHARHVAHSSAGLADAITPAAWSIALLR